MAGYWNKSRTQELDQNDNLIVGAKAYFLEAGILVPMAVYSSATLGEANEHPHPVETDGNGRWPNVFFDDVTDVDLTTPGVQGRRYYRVQVTDAYGVLLYDDDSVPIIGQATGPRATPVPVDQNALAKMGDIKIKFGTARDAGWVRCNGGSISKAASGGTEFADASTQQLFMYLWDNPTLPLAGGATKTTALNDFNIGRQLTLPDMRGRTPFGLDMMGTLISSNRIASAYVDTVVPVGPGLPLARDVVGAAGGDDDIALTTAQIPAHSHGATGVPAEVGPPAVGAKAALQAANHGHPARYSAEGTGGGSNAYGGLMVTNKEERHNYAAYNGVLTIPGPDGGGTEKPEDAIPKQIGGSGLLAVTGFTSNTGGPPSPAPPLPPTPTGVSDRHENMPPFMLFTFLIKL